MSRVTSPSPSSKNKRPNYRVRFRHGVYPANGNAAPTRADIKKYDYFFEGGQRWVCTSGNVDFVDESAQIVEDAAESTGSGSAVSSNKQRVRLACRSTKSLQLGSQAEPTNVGTVSRSTRPDARQSKILPTQQPYTPTPHVPNGIHHTWAFQPSQDCLSHLEALSQSSLPQFPLRPALPSPRLPLEDPIEAHLFRFFVDKIALWWEMTSSENVWKDVVPAMALTSPMLLYGIFAKSAQVLKSIDPTYPVNPFRYQEKLLTILIPYLAERDGIDDEATLAAAMLLRAFEEFQTGTEGQVHLSTFELFTAEASCFLDIHSPVVKACFLLHVRYEIMQSLVGQPSLRVNYGSFILPALVAPADEVAWCNRMVWICAYVLQWCQTVERTMDGWRRMTSLVDEWEMSRPDSFRPFFYRPANATEERYFPDIWYSTGPQVDGNQYLRIARMALAVHDPSTTHHAEIIDDVRIRNRLTILEGLKAVVAMAQCNTQIVPSHYLAFMAVSGFAVHLEEHQDRLEMVRFLQEGGSKFGWRTEVAVARLENQWN